MKKRSIIKSLSWVLVLCILFSQLPASAVAVGQEEAPAEASREITLSDVIAGVATIEDLYGKLDEAAVPDAIGYDEAVKKQHVARLYEEEGDDLNKVIFLNADGSKTMYSFDFPVKYRTASGEVQDISLKIADSKLSTAPFTSAAGNAVTTFSANLSDGISLSGNGVNIDLVPLLPAGSSGNTMAQTGSMSAPSGNMTLHTATRLDDKTVSYYYDDKTTIEYSLTYTGFKEDIVVSEYTGQTEYSFLLSTGGYALEEIDGSYFLADDAGNIKATIGDIIIFTADERNNTMGHIVPTTVKEKEQYLLTIVIDEDYLADENTAYPIRIDPTVEITYALSGAGKIEDATVYTADTTNTYLGSIFVGNKQNGGIARILMKFPGLDLDGLGDNVYIESASVSLRDLLCEATPLDVYCYVYCGAPWSEAGGVTWDTTIEAYDEYLSTYLDMQTISYTNGTVLSEQHRYHFDITEAVQGWVDGNYYQNRGLIFKAADSVETGSTYNWKTLSSYNRGSYEPRLSVTYSNDYNPLVSEGSYYINNLETGKYLKYNSGNAVGASGLLSALGNTIQWELCSFEDAYVIRAVSNPSLYLGVPEDFDESAPDTVIETVSGTDIPENCLWWIDLAESTGCLIQSQYNGEYLYSYDTAIQSWVRPGEFDTAEYDQYVWRIVSTEDYGTAVSCDYKELSGFSINSVILNIGSSATPVITKTPTNAVWASTDDFTFTRISGTGGCVTFSTTTNIFTALKIGIVTYTAIHKVTGRQFSFRIYAGRYAYELTSEFGFDASAAALICDVYNRVDTVYSNDSTLMKAWRSSRVLGGVIYGNQVYYGIKWADVAGIAYLGDEDDYFTETLGFTMEEYLQIKAAISSNYSNINSGDFAHMQISLSARLAHQLNKNGILSNIGTFCSDEDVSYLAGWLGDATLIGDDGYTSLKNDDYHADLDAENIYRLIAQGYTLTNAANAYYASLTSTNTRATIFLVYIDYETIETKIYYELIDRDLIANLNSATESGSIYWTNYYRTLLTDEQYHIDTIRNNYPDTYNFICSVRDGRANIASY